MAALLGRTTGGRLKASDWVMVLAVLAGPILAVQASLFLQRRQEVRQRRFWVFRTLMMTRATSLAPEHVQALNLIDIDFAGNHAKLRSVRDAWRIYLDHLNNPRSTPPEVWTTKREELLAALLHSMAVCLGYDFDITTIRRAAYLPMGHGEAEQDQFL